MSHDHPDDHDHDHDHESELTVDTQTQIFLEMRRQNVELLQIASRIAGYGGDHAPLKSDEIRQAMQKIWEIYVEAYEWIDPEEESEGED